MFAYCYLKQQVDTNHGHYMPTRMENLSSMKTYFHTVSETSETKFIKYLIWNQPKNMLSTPSGTLPGTIYKSSVSKGYIIFMHCYCNVTANLTKLQVIGVSCACIILWMPPAKRIGEYPIICREIPIS